MISEKEFLELKDKEKYGMIVELFNRTDTNNKLIMVLKNDLEMLEQEIKIIRELQSEMIVRENERIVYLKKLRKLLKLKWKNDTMFNQLFG